MPDTKRPDLPDLPELLDGTATLPPVRTPETETWSDTPSTTVPVPRPVAPPPPTVPRPPGAPSGIRAPTSPLVSVQGPSHVRPAAPGVPGAQTGAHEPLVSVRDYRILKPLGRGGMAHVQLGQRPDGRLAAVKLLLPQYVQDEEIVRRFMLEMRAQASLRHENVVEILEFGDHRGQWFLASEFMDAGSLRDLALKAQGRFAPPVAVALTLMLLRGLGAAHRQNLVHRDVKPANVMLKADGTAKLADFGIARTLDLPGLTKTGLLLGTPAYMSPEQARGEKIDHRSDLFSAGIVLFELLCGYNPFTGTNESASLLKVLTADPPLLFEVNPALPARLEPVLARLLARDPLQRFATADEALHALLDVYPDLGLRPQDAVAPVLASPAQAFTRWATDEAKLQLALAERFLGEGPARRPLAILAFVRAALLLPGETPAEGRVKELLGGRDPFAPPTNPRIAALEAELEKQPANHALLMQLAALHKLELGLVRAIALYKRALRARPDDGFAAGQLRSLIAEEADHALTPGHLTLKTMPPRAPAALLTTPRAPVPPLAATWTPPPARTGLRKHLPTLVWAGLGLAVVGGGLYGIGRFIQSARDDQDRVTVALREGIQASAPSTNLSAEIDRRAEQLRADVEREFVAASRLAGAGSAEAESALRTFRQGNPTSPRAVDATFLLAKLYLQNRQHASAVDELERFTTEGAADPRVAEARWMLAQAHEGQGATESALRAVRALVQAHPSSPLVTKALAKEAELLEKSGDVATAQVRWEDVKSRTGPSDELHQAADAALARLGGAAPPP